MCGVKRTSDDVIKDQLNQNTIFDVTVRFAPHISPSKSAILSMPDRLI